MAMAKKKSPKTLPKPTYMGGGAGGARTTRTAGAGVAKRKATGIKNAKGLEQMKKALSTSKPPKRTTPASKPTTELERNIGRHSALRKKFPEKFNPSKKK
jgi:hypothetical protein